MWLVCSASHTHIDASILIVANLLIETPTGHSSEASSMACEGDSCDDDDWLTFGEGGASASALVPAHAPESNSGGSDDDWLEFGTTSALVPASANEPNRKRKFKLSAPTRRTPLEAEFAASRMREKKAILRAMRAQASCDAAQQQAISLINEHGALRQNSKMASMRVTSRGAGGLQRGVVLNTQMGCMRRRRGFTWGTMLSMSFNKLPHMMTVARLYKTSRAWVRQVQNAVAYAILVSIMALLNTLSCMAEAKPPTVFVASLVFDETMQRMLMPLPNLLPGQVRSSWHVLVSCSLYSCAWVDADQQERGFFSWRRTDRLSHSWVQMLHRCWMGYGAYRMCMATGCLKRSACV